MTKMPLLYFMTLPSYVDRRRCLLLEKSSIPYALQFMYIVILLQKYVKLQWYCPYTRYTNFFNSIVYNLIGIVVIALARNSDVQSSSHTRIL
jgi:hypothetical protein